MSRSALIVKLMAVLAVCGSVLGAVAPADAQTPRASRPYRGLFAGGAGDWEQQLSASGSAGVGYDDNILAGIRGGGGPQRARAGTLGQFSGSLNYSLARGRLGAGASAGSTVGYYPGTQSEFVDLYNASAGISVRLLDRPAVSANQSVMYRPYTLTTMFPGVTDPGDGEIEALEFEVVPVREHVVMYSGGISAGQQISRRTTLDASYGYGLRETSYLGGRLLSQHAGGGMSLELTRGLALRLGYQYSEGRYSGDRAPFRNHQADIGLRFNRALSLTRRTTFSFGTGSYATVHEERTRFRAAASARLNHEIGRTWHAALSYNRGMRFIETLLQPVFSDSASLSFGGLINRRLRFDSSAHASLGTVGVAGNNGYDTYRGLAGLSMALTRHMAVSLNYSYYRYRFDDGILLPPGVMRDLDRQSVRAQVNMWMPLFQRARRP